MTNNLKKALMVLFGLIPDGDEFEIYNKGKAENFTSDGITVNGNVIEFNLGDERGDLGRFKITVEEMK